MAQPPSGSANDGGGGGGSGGATPASLAATLRHMLTVDDEDFDCTILLVMPEEPASEKDSEPAEGRPAKRAKQQGGGGGRAPVPSAVACRASSVALKQHSEVFRCWMTGWIAKSKKQRPNHTLQIECDDREEVEAFQRMLDYVHSAGHVLPDDAGSILALLAVARKHAAEACADACVQLLLGKVEQLPLKACLRLLSLLETGVSGKDDVQAAADTLFLRATQRLSALLKQSVAAVAADAELQAELAAFLGHWHTMLNCSLRREVWLALPFEILLAMFEDCHVHTDTEATVLAAFALWANANIADVRLADDARGRIAAVCSCIRFPEVPPDVLINYWACFSWLQQYDRNRDLLLRALATAADKVQRALLQRQAGEAEELLPSVAAAAPRTACRLWWTERQLPLLAGDTDTATFALQISHPGDSDEVASAPVHWRGYFWQCKLGLSHEGGTKVSISAGCSAGAPRFAGYEAGPFLYQTQAIYRLRLIGSASSSSSEDSLDPLQGIGLFSPASFFHNRGACHVLDHVTWQRFWAADSPYLRSGRAEVELTLAVQPS